MQKNRLAIYIQIYMYICNIDAIHMHIYVVYAKNIIVNTFEAVRNRKGLREERSKV